MTKLKLAETLFAEIIDRNGRCIVQYQYQFIFHYCPTTWTIRIESYVRKLFRAVLSMLLFSRTSLTIQRKTCTRVTVTTQNMYTCHCHNTKNVHVPLSQRKTCTRTTVTIQNMYTCRCHNTKHVHLPLSQYKTCTRAAVTIQNMHACHCHNTKHVRVPLSQ